MTNAKRKATFKIEKLEDYDNSQFLFGSKGEILFADDVEITEPVT